MQFSTRFSNQIDTVFESLGWPVQHVQRPVHSANDQSIISHREVGSHTRSFAGALRAVTRQDADVVLVGEMRDRETFEAAMHAAETGHLVFCTIHAGSAATTLGRILDFFPQSMHLALRSAITCQPKTLVSPGCRGSYRRRQRPSRS